MSEPQTNYARGVGAEELAEKHLSDKGFQILRKRFKTKFGEIDLITQKDNLICFVEVKIRQKQEDALESVTKRARKRIEQSALVFLSQNPQYENYDLRFDVVAISAPFHILHLDNAWETPA